MKSYIHGFVITIQFFSILPLRKEIPMTNQTIERAIRMFPAFGWLLGLIYAGFLYSLIEWTILSLLAIAFLIWLTTIVLTGGIHLDGWMDASDAFFSYRDLDKRLEIMKDPRTGAFGVISVIVLLSARFLFIYEVVQRIESLSFLLILFIPFFSRMVMGMMLASVPPAKNEGLGKLFHQASKQSTIWSYLAYLLPTALIMWLWNWHGMVLLSAMFLFTLILNLALRSKVRKWFRGITGDIIGALVEGVEVILWMIVWLFHYSVIG